MHPGMATLFLPPDIPHHLYQASRRDWMPHLVARILQCDLASLHPVGAAPVSLPWLYRATASHLVTQRLSPTSPTPVPSPNQDTGSQHSVQICPSPSPLRRTLPAGDDVSMLERSFWAFSPLYCFLIAAWAADFRSSLVLDRKPAMWHQVLRVC